MSDADLLLEEVSAYLKPKDVEHIRTGGRVRQKRASGANPPVPGDPYISHPIAVARILAPLHLDAQAIVAALLHDVMEDTPVGKEEVAEKFGKPVAELVDGLTKLNKIEFETKEDAQAENFRKMLLAMTRDVRVILIKLADRLHNMRTLGSLSREKSKRIARETMEIYAPIANRLGLNSIYQELEDLSFKYLYPDALLGAVQGADGCARQSPRGGGQDPGGHHPAPEGQPHQGPGAGAGKTPVRHLPAR